MGFVYRSGKSMNIQDNQYVGPGSYHMQSVGSSPLLHAFNSTGTRNNTIKNQLPGPGYYNPQQSMNSSKIIVAYPGKLKTLQMGKPWGIFRSKVDRFKQVEQQNLNEHHQKSSINKEQTRIKMSNSYINRKLNNSVPSIPGNERSFGYYQVGDNYILNKNPITGFDGTSSDIPPPGYYQVSNSWEAKFPKWKVPNKRTKVSDETSPNQYSMPKNKQLIKQGCSNYMFKSNDKREYEKKKGQRIRQMLLNKYYRDRNNCLKGVQQICDYQKKVEQKDRLSQFKKDKKINSDLNQFFLSKAKRFNYKDVQSKPMQPIKPINTQSMNQPKFKNKKPIPFLSKKIRFQKKPQQNMEFYQYPYQIQKRVLNKKQGNIEMFGAAEQRFHQEIEVSPGPGQYQIRKQKKIGGKGCLWGMREVKEEEKNLSGPGNYQIAKEMGKPQKGKGRRAPFNTSQARLSKEQEQQIIYLVKQKEQQQIQDLDPKPRFSNLRIPFNSKLDRQKYQYFLSNNNNQLNLPFYKAHDSLLKKSYNVTFIPQKKQ